MMYWMMFVLMVHAVLGPRHTACLGATPHNLLYVLLSGVIYCFVSITRIVDAPHSASRPRKQASTFNMNSH